jgi:S-DNA-T family DNA segregation ATPase FtsK/SpoIIIE
LDFAILAFVLAVAFVIFRFYPDTWERAYVALGYGWIPVLLWGGVFLAGAAALMVGILTFFDAGYGPLAFVGLGGEWGSRAMGGSTLLGIARLALLALLIPILALPRKTGRGYWLGLFYAARGLWSGLVALARGLAFIAAAIGRGAASRFSRNTRPGWLHAVFSFLARLPSPMFRRSPRPDPVLSTTTVVNLPGEGAETNEPPEAVVPPTPTTLSAHGSKWKLPSLDLLAPAEVHSTDEKPLKKMAGDIESALSDHGVSVEVADIKAGPRIVRFGLMPGWIEKKGAGKDGANTPERSRVRVQSILARERDLSLAISSPSLRFEQVPGEALLGLEVPSPSPSKVTMREVMDSADFRKFAAKGGLPIALGADAGGGSVAMDLTGLPHMMIAGATGSGKSVCINSIVASMMLTKPPDQLRMLMVDPKQVELTPFNGIPHLVLPVITEVDEVSPMLRGLIREMTRRYKAMAEIGTRNITGYNGKVKAPMPYLVLIVDELADLMLVGGFEIEQSLVRLAQLGRAAGIHLVLATQRPSVKVVTGLLKANIPCRVAFAVASQVDARVILDSVGAEKLLGKGDMLLLNNDAPKPRRVQGTLVLDEETEKLVDFWLNQKGPPLPPVNLEEDEEEGEDAEGLDGGLVDKARELALRNPNLSASALERRLKIGGSRAEQIVEALEDEGLLIPR